MNGVSTRNTAGAARLYVWCVLWGLATGAVVGSVTGALLAAYDLRFLLLGLLAGAVIGAIVAVIPSLLGAVVVTAVISSRHPHPASEEDVRRDLGTLVFAVVGTLDALLLVAIFLWGDGSSSLVRSLPFVAAGNVAAAVVLRPARTSIARTWLHT